jgi:hypothetical protein
MLVIVAVGGNAITVTYVVLRVHRYNYNRAFMGRGGEVHSHPKSCAYKYQGAVGGYPDGMAQLSPEVFRPRRVAALRRARGGPTRY